MSPGGKIIPGIEHVSNLSHLRGYTSSHYTPPLIHHCFRAALGDIKSQAPLACPEHMIPGQKKLFGSTAGAHSKKPPACVEIMRAGGMWAPTVQLCGSCPLWRWEPRLPPRSAAWPGSLCSWRFAGSSACTVLKLTHPGAGLWLLSPLPCSPLYHRPGPVPAG